MEEFEISPEKILKAFGKYVYQVDDKKCGKDFVIRANVNSPGEAERLFTEITQSTQTGWRQHKHAHNPKRFLYRKVKICQFNSKNKVQSSKRSTNCTAKFSIRIKKVTKATQYSDPLLKQTPPLCGEIQMTLKHNHPVNSADFLQKLWVSDEVKIEFFSYFGDGMTPSVAMSYHKNKLLSLGDVNILSNSALNPTGNQVYHLYRLWRRHNFGLGLNPKEKQLKENLYDEKGYSASDSIKSQESVSTSPFILHITKSPVNTKIQVKNNVSFRNQSPLSVDIDENVSDSDSSLCEMTESNSVDHQFTSQEESSSDESLLEENSVDEYAFKRFIDRNVQRLNMVSKAVQTDLTMNDIDEQSKLLLASHAEIDQLKAELKSLEKQIVHPVPARGFRRVSLNVYSCFRSVHSLNTLSGSLRGART